MAERDVNPTPFSKLNPVVVIVVIIAVVIVGSIVSSAFVVDQSEQGVVLFLGKFNRYAEPGLNWKLPFGIEQNFNVQSKVLHTLRFGFRVVQAGVNTEFSSRDYPEESVMLTGDLNIIDVEWTIQYRITDPRAWLFNVENKEKTIRDISQSVINQMVGDRTILDVIGEERTSIETQGQELMNEILKDYGLGITINAVKLKNVVPPQGSVQDAFEDVNKAIQDMNRLINEGKEAYNKTVPKAEGEADKLIQIAEGYASERVNEALGNVARFRSVYEEYRKNPAITKTRLYYEMIEDVFKGMEGTDLIDKNLDNFIPLKSLGELGGVQ